MRVFLALMTGLIFTFQCRQLYTMGGAHSRHCPLYKRVSLARRQVCSGPHSLLHQVLAKVELRGLSSSGLDGLSAFRQDVRIAQTVEIPLMLIADGEGTRMGDTVLEAQDPGDSPRMVKGESPDRVTYAMLYYTKLVNSKL